VNYEAFYLAHSPQYVRTNTFLCGRKELERFCKNLARSYKTEIRICTPLPMSTISFFQCQWLHKRRIVYFFNTLTLKLIYCANIQLNCKILGRKRQSASSFRIFMQNFRRHLWAE